MRKFYPENSARVHGVVYMGSGNRISDALAGADVPAMVLRGTRDPFCPPEVRSNGVGLVVVEYGYSMSNTIRDRFEIGSEFQVTPTGKSPTRGCQLSLLGNGQKRVYPTFISQTKVQVVTNIKM